jgi:glycosyltransferase involved in cell wall biosynthesis
MFIKKTLLMSLKFKVKIYLINKILKFGGPSRFYEKLISYLKDEFFIKKYNKNYKIKKNDLLFTTGTFKIYQLIKNKSIFRVDGFLWQNKYLANAGFLKFCYEKIYNLNIIILLNTASAIIYQSKFVKKIWNKYLIKKKKTFIIYNTNYNKLLKKIHLPQKKIICVEGNLSGAFNAIHHLRSINDYQVEVYGNYSRDLKEKIKSKKNIILKGHIPHARLVEKLRYSNIILFSLELFPACSNSVIEAMCNGIPVVGFRTGCMNEFFGKRYKYLIDHNIEECTNNLCLKKIDLDSIFKQIFDNYNSISKKNFLLSKKFNSNNFKKKYSKVFNSLNEN